MFYCPRYLHLSLIHSLSMKQEQGERGTAALLYVRITHIWIIVSYFDNGSTDGRNRRHFARVITVQIPAQVLQLCVKARPPQIHPLLFLLSLNISVLSQLWLPEDMKMLIHGESSESSGWPNSFAWKASTEQFLSRSVTRTSRPLFVLWFYCPM